MLSTHGQCQSELPTLMPECSKEGHLERGGMPKRIEIWLFQGVDVHEIG